jgi:hypothetical protein
MADIVVADDDVGTNVLTLTGTDAAEFALSGTELYLKAGATIPTGPDTMTVTVNVNDATVPPSPNDTAVFTLTVNAVGGGSDYYLDYVNTDLVPTSGTLTSWDNSGSDSSANNDLDTIGGTPNVTGTSPPTGATFFCEFDGVNEYAAAQLDSAQATALGDDTVGVIFLWFRLADASANTDFYFSFGNSSNADGRVIIFPMFNGAVDCFVLSTPANSARIRTESGTTLSDATWHKIAIRQNATQLDIFIDGSKEATPTRSVAGTGANSDWLADIASAQGSAYLDFVCIGANGNGGTPDRHSVIDFAGASISSLSLDDATLEALTT